MRTTIAKASSLICVAADGINRWAGHIASALCLVLVLATVVDVLLRYFFRAGSVAVQEAEWHIFAVIILFGAGYALQQDKHVRVDVFYARMSERVRAKIDFFCTLFFLMPFCLIGLITSVPFVERAYRFAESSPDPGGLPHRFLIKAVITFGFALLMLQGMALLIRSFQKGWGK